MNSTKEQNARETADISWSVKRRRAKWTVVGLLVLGGQVKKYKSFSSKEQGETGMGDTGKKDKGKRWNVKPGGKQTKSFIGGESQEKDGAIKSLSLLMGEWKNIVI